MAYMIGHDNFERAKVFQRLVDCYQAAMRWEMYNSARVFENKLVMMGAWRDDDGCWRIDYANQSWRER